MSRKLVYRIMVLSALAAFTVACGARSEPSVSAPVVSASGQSGR